MGHREGFSLADFDVRERRLSLGEGGRETFLVVDQRLSWTDAAALGLDQIASPASPLPLDCSPISAGKLRGDVQGVFNAEGSPQRIRQSFRALRERARPRSYLIFFFGSGIWNMGFIAPIIRGVNPSLKLWVTAALPVFLVLNGLLEVAAHASGIDRPIVVPAKHAIAFELHKKRCAFLFRNP